MTAGLPARAEDTPPAWRWPLLAVAYGATWLALEQFSQVLWFLPAGLRLGVLWLTPTRRWGWLAAAEWTGLALKTVLVQQQSLLQVSFLALNIVPWLVYAGVVLAVRGPQPPERLDTPRRMVGLLGAGALAAAAISPVLSYYFTLPGEVQAVNLAGAFAFLYGDLLGQVVLAPLLLAVATSSWRSRLRPALWGDLALVLAFAATVFAVLRARADLAPYVLLLAFAPLFYIAFRQGWEGAAVAVAAIGLLIRIFVLLGVLPVEVTVLQLVLAVVGAGALVLGAASTALRHSHEALALRHRELAGKSEELVGLATELRQVSQRLVRLEEQGQREVAGELDYQLGQAIHSLGTRISLAFRDSRDEHTVRLLESLREQVREIQDSLRRALRQLRPAMLDSQGLRQALAEGPLREMLDDAGVEYEAHFYGRVDALDDDARTAVYRICQAAVREAARGDACRKVTVKLDVMPHALDRLAVELQVDAEYSAVGTRLPPATRLPAISDRVLAQQGAYEAEPLPAGLRHHVWFEAASPEPG